MSRKMCFVPSCNNTSDNAPFKIFLTVPTNVAVRKKWFSVVKTKQLFHLAHNMFCCEDHFNLEEDAANWMYYKMMGSSIKLKTGVVPHRFIDSHPLELQSRSALTDSERKRKIEFQEEFKKRAGTSTRKPNYSRQLLPDESPKPLMVETKLHSPSGNLGKHVIQLPHIKKKSVAVQVSVKNKFRSVGTNTKLVKRSKAK